MTPAVHAILVKANAARDARRWEEAADGFQHALLADPRLGHIWLQLGNALKEAGRLAEAEQAYRRAGALRPQDPEPDLQLGWLLARDGRPMEAGLRFERAFELAPHDALTAAGVHRALAAATGGERVRIGRLIEAKTGVEAPPAAQVGKARLALDVSDLLTFWGGARLPTGIQRVQIQLLVQAGDFVACVFLQGRGAFFGLEPALIGELAQLSLSDADANDPVWLRALHRLHLSLAAAEPLEFAQGAMLIGLGASWQLRDYFLALREAKRRFGLRYAPLIYDLIAVMAPQYFTPSARREFLPWVPAMLAHADAILAISAATRRDVLSVAARLDHALDPEDVRVVTLDADSADAAPPAPPDVLQGWSLAPGGFVLFVATLEPRKGHAVALNAWRRLLDRRGPETPTLVCVGKPGWLYEDILDRLKQDGELAAKVRILGGVGEAALERLYRDCLFTIYPSFYEGWGLPVTEALCRGKAVVTTTAASLPEAGGDLAVYVAPGDAPALADAVERLAFEPGALAKVEARIAASFRARSWTQVSAALFETAARIGEKLGRAPPVLPDAGVPLGVYHTLGAPPSDALMAYPGEYCRRGTGWNAPSGLGVTPREEGGLLVTPLPPGLGELCATMRLAGPRSGTATWRIEVEAGPSLAGALSSGEMRWVWFHAAPRAELRLRLSSTPLDAPDAPDPPTVALAGFHLCAAGDLQARIALLEAALTGDLDESALESAHLAIVPSAPR